MFTITDVRNFFGKRMTWIMVIMAIVMLITMASFFGRGAAPPVEGVRGQVFATVDGQTVSHLDFDNLERQGEEQISQQLQGGRLTADRRLQAHAMSILTMVSNVVQMNEAKRLKIEADDDLVMKVARAQFDQQLDQERENLVAQKKLAANATPAQFIDAFRKENGRSADALWKQKHDELQKQLDDKTAKEDLYQQATFWALKEQFKKNVRATPTDYERSMDQVTLARVLVKSSKHKNARERIDEAAKLLKQGVAIDTVADQLGDYDVEPAPNAKTKPKKSDVGGKRPRGTLDMDPMTKDLADKPEGYLSGVKTAPDGYAIYKIVSIAKGTLPPDYATRKDKYVKDYRDQKATQVYNDWLMQHVASAKVEINSKPWQLLYDWGLHLQLARRAGTPPTPDQQEKQNLETMRKAAAIVKSKVDDWREALLLQLFLTTQLSATVKDIKAKDEVKALRQQALDQSAGAIDDPSVWMQAADNYVKEQQYSRALKMLIRVSQSAYSPTDPSDQSAHWGVKNMLTLIQSKGYKGADLDEALAREAKYDARARAQALKNQEIRDRALAAQRAREEKKKLEEQKKNPTATGGTKGATSSTGSAATKGTAAPTPGPEKGSSPVGSK